MLLEATQDTPTTNKKQPNYVQFGSSVHIQTPVNQMANDAAVVIEFKHYKVSELKILLHSEL
jgi:hypothetical protein